MSVDTSFEVVPDDLTITTAEARHYDDSALVERGDRITALLAYERKEGPLTIPCTEVLEATLEMSPSEAQKRGQMAAFFLNCVQLVEKNGTIPQPPLLLNPATQDILIFRTPPETEPQAQTAQTLTLVPPIALD